MIFGLLLAPPPETKSWLYALKKFHLLYLTPKSGLMYLARMEKRWQQHSSLLHGLVLFSALFGLASLATSSLSIAVFARQYPRQPEYAHQVRESTIRVGKPVAEGGARGHAPPPLETIFVWKDPYKKG